MSRLPSLPYIVKSKSNSGPPARPPEPENTPFPRRELGRIVHDDRGMASMEWAPASGGAERQVLEIIDDPGRGRPLEPRPKIDPGGGFNPYASATPVKRDAVPLDAPRKPRDLRKLGEWINMMREREASEKAGKG
jgi:hypothetical protein